MDDNVILGFVSGVVVTIHGATTTLESKEIHRETQQEHDRKFFRALWLELHDKGDPTPDWFADWVSRVPNFGCGCQDWLREYLVTNPPRYNDWHSWTVDLHNAVNVKLGKPLFVSEHTDK